MTGAVIKIIGNKNDPGVDIMSIVSAHDVRTDWPEDAMKQANNIPDHVTEEEKKAESILRISQLLLLMGMILRTLTMPLFYGKSRMAIII